LSGDETYVFVAYRDEGRVARYVFERENRATVVVRSGKGGHLKIPKHGKTGVFDTREKAEESILRAIRAEIGNLERELASLRRREESEILYRDLSS
jgi:hypothetical protein